MRDNQNAKLKMNIIHYLLVRKSLLTISYMQYIYLYKKNIFPSPTIFSQKEFELDLSSLIFKRKGINQSHSVLTVSR